MRIPVEVFTGIIVFDSFSEELQPVHLIYFLMLLIKLSAIKQVFERRINLFF